MRCLIFRFDGENTWFYFLWYGLGRSWIEGLRTDSLYLFNWELFGQRIPGVSGAEYCDGGGGSLYAVL